MHCAPSIVVAEAAKVIANAQRELNIAFVNDLAMDFDTLGIETKYVLETDETKWNFVPFQPGLVGGYCISVDPYYLSHIATKSGYIPKILMAGRAVNEPIPRFIVKKLSKFNCIDKINNKVLKRVLLLGYTFKENDADIRNSKCSDLVAQFIQYGIIVDPYLNCNFPLVKKVYNKIEEVSDLYDAIILQWRMTILN